MLIEYAKDDTRQDYLRVTGALAVVTIFLTRIPFFLTRIPFANLENLNHRPKLALFAGLACFVSAAIAYFSYVQRTHLVRRDVIRCMLDANAGEAEETLETRYKKLRPLHWSASALFLVGIVAMGYVLWALVG